MPFVSYWGHDEVGYSSSKCSDARSSLCFLSECFSTSYLLNYCIYIYSCGFVSWVGLFRNWLSISVSMASNSLRYENYDPCFPDQPVVDRYLPVWANQPSFRSKPAFVWSEDGHRSSITYGQLNSSVHSIASQLLIPLQRGDTVLVLCPPGLQLVKTLFACQRAGLLSVPISLPEIGTLKSPHHLIRAILQTKPKSAIAYRSHIPCIRRCLLSSSSNNTQLSQLLEKLQWLSVDEFEDGNDDNLDVCHSHHSHYTGCKPEEVYLIQYTSGATGIPKPVLVTAGAATHNARMARKAYDLQPNSIIVSWLPQYHDCGLMFLLLTIVSGATCVLASPITFVNRPRIWLDLITEFQATCTPVPSFALPLAIRRGGIDKGSLPLKLGSLRNLILINEPIYRRVVEEFIDEFSPVGLYPSSISPSYGLAENCTFVSTAWRSVDVCGNSGTFPNIPSYKNLLPSARLLSSLNEDDEEEIEIVVIDEETCEPVQDGIEGEIWVSSPSNALGYLGYPSLTNEVFYGRIQGKLSHTFVRTGDRGIVLGEQRYLFVMGRAADVIRIRGGLELHPHYLETAAYESCPKYLRGGCIAAIELSTTIVIVAELQRVVRGLAPYYMNICEGIKEAVLKHGKVQVGLVMLVRSGSLPKTTSGKLQRWAAKEKVVNGELRAVSEVRFTGGQMELSSLVVNAVVEKREGDRKANDHHRLPLLSFL